MFGPMRPEILFPLFAPVSSLPGVGPKLARLIGKVAGERVIDLVFLAPTGFIDRSYRPKVMEAEENRIVTLDISVLAHQPPPRKGLPWRVACYDDSGPIDLVFFSARGDYVPKVLPVAARRRISGMLGSYNGRKQIVHPDFIVDPAKGEDVPAFENVYPLTEGLGARVMAKAVRHALELVPDLAEWQDASFLKQNSWPGWRIALAGLHAPFEGGGAPAEVARRRLAFDELLANQLTLLLARERQRGLRGRKLSGDGALRKTLLGHLPWKLTADQQTALSEIDADMASDRRMTRLLQGDVGSGKTIVALMAMLSAVEAGAQAALMAPTEILARQHFATLSALCQKISVEIVLLTGRERGKPREEILAAIASGRAALAVGTHALFSEDVAFADLGLAVIDEQHRFGVSQRAALVRKGGEPVDTLAMTATPIPRTLELTLYGDMDVSRIRERPPGRQKIDTRAVPLSRISDVVDAVQRALSRGERIYWICPMVNETEDSDLAAVTARFEVLSKRFGSVVALAHGQMKGVERDAAMERFRSGDARVLVATTVVEVGVDVPEATIIIIEHADRFGLSQLHQLRGRVGRGTKPSHCILLYQDDPPLGDTARARLTAIRETDDGFRIAEEDLRLRGAGDVLGTRQSGDVPLRLARLETDRDLIEAARDDARLVLLRDPALQSARGQALRTLLYLFERDEAVRLLRTG